jgi:uncharacterized protein YecA (UPF0149 family)
MGDINYLSDGICLKNLLWDRENRRHDLQIFCIEGGMKIGRHAPCPCGSGKKYKKG